MKILAIHAHPDDIEFLAAGTLAILKETGYEIALATLSSGDKGSPDKTREAIAAIRREEARRSAELLNANYTCLEFADFEIFDDLSSRRAVTEFMRKEKPDIVLTASTIDYMADHEAAGVLVRNAAFMAGVRNFDTGSAAPLTYIPALYYMDPIEGTDHYGRNLPIDFCVDITERISIKEKMLACHASQREWLRSHHGVDRYLDAMKEWSARRGNPFDFKYGEGFRQHKGHAYPHENVLAKLLPTDLVKYGR